MPNELKVEDLVSPYKVKEILFTRRYPGYIYRRELVDDSEYGGDGGLEMICCYSSETGDWIGNSKIAIMLCKKRGIRDIQKRKADHCVASIGFNPQEQKWYGWSHRAIYGFGIGSTCKEGNCGYVPNTVDGLFDSITKPDEEGWAWQKPEDVKKVKGGIEIHHKMLDTIGENSDGSLITKDKGAIDIQFIETGRGEWTAQTLEEAKQMACDFASGVS